MLAVVLTLLAVGAVALAGGFERAGTAAKSAARVAADVVVAEPEAAVGDVADALRVPAEEAPVSPSDQGTETPAFDQYGTEITICHRPGFEQVTMRVASVEAHLAHGDYVGPCW